MSLVMSKKSTTSKFIFDNRTVHGGVRGQVQGVGLLDGVNGMTLGGDSVWSRPLEPPVD